MRYNKIFTCLIMAMLIFSVTGTASAQGKGPDWSDPTVVAALSGQLANAGPAEQISLWNQQSPEAQAAVKKFNKVANVKLTDGLESAPLVTIQAAGCSTKINNISAYNYLGVRLYIYWSQVEWCYNGTTVTSKFWTHGATIPFPSMWQWTRDAGFQENGGVGSTNYRVWTEAEMSLAIAGYPIQVSYPWVDITVRGAGTSTSTSGE
jgi:hypothetical protein